MKLFVLGATGRTGTEIVRQALAAGHEVTAFVRDRGKLTVRDPGLSVRVGDVKNTLDLRESLPGHDAVLTALGSNKAGDELIKASTTALVQAMRQSGVQRVVMLSSIAAAPTYRARGLMRLLGFLMRGMVADKASGESVLRRSGLDWTIVYATSLRDGPKTASYRVSTVETVPPSANAVRADVADFMLKQATDPAFVRQSPVIVSG
jgi:putative NADH-flavin reductase